MAGGRTGILAEPEYNGESSQPVNPAYTSTELDYVLNDSDAEFLIIEDQFLSTLETMNKRPEAMTDESIIIVTDKDINNKIVQNTYDLLIDTTKYEIIITGFPRDLRYYSFKMNADASVFVINTNTYYIANY